MQHSNGINFLDFAALIRAILPEKAGEFDRVSTALGGVEFELDETSERIKFQADSDTKRIIVGVRSLARLMVHCYAYFVALKTLIKLKSEKKTTSQLDAEDLARLKSVNSLLTWAVSMDVNNAFKLTSNQNQFWAQPPDELKDVLLGAVDAEAVDKSKAVFENALVFVLLHELAHLQHEDEYAEGLPSIEQEKAADRSAARWMLGDLDESADTFVLRAFGTSAALGWLTTLDVYLGPSGSDTHPPSYDRLYQTINEYAYKDGDPSCELVWAFIKTILLLHLKNVGVSLDPGREVGPFRDQVQYYINIIAKS